MKTVFQTIKDFLHDFINDRSDNSPMEATKQESFEKGFNEFVDGNKIDIIDALINDFQKSLSPMAYCMAIISLHRMVANSNNLIITTELQSEYKKCFDMYVDQAENYLKTITSNEGTAIDRTDAIAVLGLN